MNKINVLIIGAGPAGMMAAITAAKNNANVTILEKNSVPGKKLNITGKGRCNISYVGNTEYFLSNVVTNPKFMMSSISNFNNEDLVEYINSLGVKTKEERGNRVFLASDDAHELTNALQKELNRLGVKIKYNTSVKSIVVNEEGVTGVITNTDEVINSDKVLIATGGTSYSSTGSTGDGYILAKQVGHSIVDVKSALVPLILKEQAICKSLRGVTLKNVDLKIQIDDKLHDKRFGELMFTDKGITGPIVLSSSSKLNKVKDLNSLALQDRIKVVIDLKPALNEQELYKRITRDFEKYINKEFKNALGDLTISSLIPVIIAKSGISDTKKVNSITKEEKERLVKMFKGLEFTFKELENINAGIVTSGGVNIKEINPKTMESKLVKGLFFAGEVIDVDAYTGGFNLQIAFSTGYIAGINMGEV